MSLLLVLLAVAAGITLLLLVVWLLIMVYVKATSRGGPVERFFEPGEGELPPEERVKHVGGFKHGSGSA
jgi:hypothetical protein